MKNEKMAWVSHNLSSGEDGSFLKQLHTERFPYRIFEELIRTLVFLNDECKTAEERLKIASYSWEITYHATKAFMANRDPLDSFVFVWPRESDLNWDIRIMNILYWISNSISYRRKLDADELLAQI
jgi:hypothetical protein